MKNRVRFISAGLLALILAFGGCSNPLGEQPASPEAGSGGKLVIQLGDVDARTLAPAADSIEEYRLVLETSSKIESEEVFALEDLPLERLVDSSDWTVNVYGLINDENRCLWLRSSGNRKG